MDIKKHTIQDVELTVQELVLDQVIYLADLLEGSGLKYDRNTSPIKFIKQLKKKNLLKPAMAIIFNGDNIEQIEPGKIKLREMAGLFNDFFTLNVEAAIELIRSSQEAARMIIPALRKISGAS